MKYPINTEHYGIYCGKYNTNISNAKELCQNDNNCKWNELINNDGKSANWCGQRQIVPDDDDTIIQ
jgi:hypothetical protein